ncbi:MAG: putative rhamnosyl transferase, partial [Pseudomonadota bacterium]
VIGLCRFSYPAIGGFQVDHNAIADRISYLYAPERLSERFRLFETVSLPGLRAQTDQDFTLLIAIGDSLPKLHVDRLHDLTHGMPQVRIVARGPQRHRAVMKDLLNAARLSPDQPCIQFRHDDDDAVSLDFVERLRQTASDSSGLLRSNRTVALDFNRGYVAEFGSDGVSAAEQVRPLCAVALAMHVAPKCNQTIMNFAHHKMGQFMPVISQTDEPMWVRSHNAYNDSRQKNAKQVPVAPLTPDQERDFAIRFAIDADQVRRVFGSA